MLFKTMSQLGDTIKGTIALSEGRVRIIDPNKIRGPLIDHLVWTAVFHEKTEMRGTARWIIKMAGAQLGIYLSSIQSLYEAKGRKEYDGFTVPAINIRGMTYDTARAIFRVAIRNDASAFILEIAKSEMEYTKQSPSEYVAVIMAAAIQEGFQGPLFIQGDHFQLNAKKFRADPEKTINSIKDLIKDAISAGFYNIDIDSSTLVDLDPPDLVEQQRNNFEVAADLTAYIRSLEPEGITVSVGGEIGEVGGKNSSVGEFKVFTDHFLDSLKKKGNRLQGISKISVQTGTSHGGVPLPDGSVASVKLDFDVLQDISRAAQELYGISGAVQHGASTLPESVFDRFPKTGTAEIHLATQFQNMIYDGLPGPLKEEIYTYVRETFPNEKKDGQTDEQFIYKTRKKGIGAFKKTLWELPSDIRTEIATALEEKFSFLFRKLNVIHSKQAIHKTINTVEVSFALKNEITAAEAESLSESKGPSEEEDNPLAD